MPLSALGIYDASTAGINMVASSAPTIVNIIAVYHIAAYAALWRFGLLLRGIVVPVEIIVWILHLLLPPLCGICLWPSLLFI